MTSWALIFFYWKIMIAIKLYMNKWNIKYVKFKLPEYKCFFEVFPLFSVHLMPFRAILIYLFYFTSPFKLKLFVMSSMVLVTKQKNYRNVKGHWIFYRENANLQTRSSLNSCFRMFLTFMILLISIGYTSFLVNKLKWSLRTVLYQHNLCYKSRLMLSLTNENN